MAELSLRSVAADCLGLRGRLSVKRDVLGVHGYNDIGTGAEPRSPVRSLRRRLSLALHAPFVRLALVTVRPEGSDPAPVDGLQRDLDTANEILQIECGVWILCTGTGVWVTDRFGSSVTLSQDDCFTDGHSVSRDEDVLFDQGRSLGADIVGYYITRSTGGSSGCAAHPPGRRGFWVSRLTPMEIREFIFTHELCHVVGDLGHEDAKHLKQNLMCPGKCSWTRDQPPTLLERQCRDVRQDPAIGGCAA